MPTPPALSQTSGNDLAYRDAAEQLLGQIERTLDRWLQEDVVDIDCARSGGMLTLHLPDRSQIVVNMQPPLQEIWLAARSGGYHFRWQGAGDWIDTRTGHQLLEVLSDCLSRQAGKSLQM